MIINTKKEDGKLLITLEGRLDTLSAPDLEKEISDNMEGITELIFDFAKVEYISSAGLRVMLVSQKAMNTLGKMIIRNVNDAVMEVFEITGFVNVITIE